MIGSKRKVGNDVNGGTGVCAGVIAPGRGGCKAIPAVNLRNPCRDSVGVRVGTVNVGTMSHRSMEVADVSARRRLDFCCLQETRWKGGSAKMLEGREGARYKFFWSGS